MATGNPITIKLSDVEQTSQELDYVAKVQSTGVVMQCPVRLGLAKNDKDLWVIPLEPLVSVRASKTIIRRNIAKASGEGTVKEQFSQDDYEISITGLLQGNTFFPEEAVAKLQSFCVAGQSVFIRAKLLDILGINQLCVTAWEFPATPGVENQKFSISGYSDQYFDLLVSN